MPRFSPLLENFNAGEWGPLAWGRTDLPKFPNSGRTMLNWVPTVQGAMRKRRGSKFITRGLGDELGLTSRLFKFVIQRDEAFIVEMAADAVPEDSMRIINADGTAGPGFVTSGVPYGPDELSEVQFAQKADRQIFVHPNHIQFEMFIDENGAVNFVTLGAQVTGPYLPENIDDAIVITFDPADSSLNASQPIFTELMAPSSVALDDGQVVRLRFIPEQLYPDWEPETEVTLGELRVSPSLETPGAVNVYEAQEAGTTGTQAPGVDRGTVSDGLINWEFKSNGFVYYTCISFENANKIIVTVPSFQPQEFETEGSVRWAFRAFSREFGWPRTVNFFQQRVIYGGTKTQPQTIWGSRIGDITDFEMDTTANDAPFAFDIDSDQKNEINYLIGTRRLIIGTGGGEFIATGAEFEGPITPTSVRIQRDTDFGSHYQQALQVGESTLFVQAGRITLRNSVFVEARDGYVGNDESLLAHHLSQLGLGRLVFTHEPDSIMWTYSLTDGQLIAMTFERLQEVVGWHRHTLSGEDPLVLDVQVIPDEDGVTERLWMIVERTIEQERRRYVEFIDERTEVYVDSWEEALVVDGTLLTGLDHLNGETVTLVIDGVPQTGTFTVEGGQVTSPLAVQQQAFVGFPYRSDYETQPLTGGSNTGTAQGKSKRIHNITMRLFEAGVGLSIGPNEDKLVPVITRNDGDNQDEQVPLFTGDTAIVPIEDGYDERGIIFVRHDVALSCTVNAMYPQMEVYDAR